MCSRRFARWGALCPQSSGDVMACRRRSLHRRWRRRCLTTSRRLNPETTSRSGSTTTLRRPALISIPSFRPSLIAPSARCSTASVRTGLWAPTRTRSRSLAKIPTTTPRVTSCTIRRSRAQRRCRTCGSGPSRFIRRIWSARPTSSRATSRFSWSGMTFSRTRSPAAHSCSTRRTARRKSGASSRAFIRSTWSTRSSRCASSTR